jgi:bifunctional DNA-binding transcriptional regulator/antitoxin component of YhaV-PrlF toxin-antitoxin module
MNACQVQVASGGYVGLPLEICKVLDIKDGDVLQLVVVNGEIHLQSRRHNIRKAQMLFRNSLSDNTSLCDELIQERKTEASHE